MRRRPVSANRDLWFAPVLAAVASLGLAAVLLLGPVVGARGQTVPSAVAADALRVCGDPANMPYSNRAKDGFENKIADIIADELKVPVRYYWMPQGPGFVRNTLSRFLCDVVIGYVSGGDPVLNTNPYYRSVYVLVVKADGPLADVTQLSDPRLKGRSLGLSAATPPADHLLELGLLSNAKTYALLVDRRYSSPAEEMIADLQAGRIDGALLWGPVGGNLAKQANGALKVVPLLHEAKRPALDYRITMGVRHTDHEWKQQLNRILLRRQADIENVLLSYGVPLLDDDDQLITAGRPSGGGG